MISELAEVDRCIRRSDDVAAVERLKRLAEQGSLSGEDRVALALMLLMPPFVDYDSVNATLAEVCRLEGPLRTEAAVWGEYVYLTLHPADDLFLGWLTEDISSAEACYMLARNAEFCGERKRAQEWIARSVSIRPFPNALLLAAGIGPSPLDREKLIRQAESLVQTTAIERHSPPRDRGELRRRYWLELIRGERLTSVVWEHNYRKR